MGIAEPVERVESFERNRALSGNYRDILISILSEKLDFHDAAGSYASHNFHSFPAKFPPQLPKKFIINLTKPGDVVLDPMLGSGTSILEAFLSGRKGIGLDIDPLALLISRVKMTPLDIAEVIHTGNNLLAEAKIRKMKGRKELHTDIEKRWDQKTRAFIDYWFATETQVELTCLLSEIEKIEDPDMRAFFDLTLSSTIITKSGGVSLALDLGHTRPHKAKILVTELGKVLLENDDKDRPKKRTRYVTKTLRSAFVEFEKKFKQNLRGIVRSDPFKILPDIRVGDAQNLDLADHSVDLIVTSPPYAANAIDYMRAHKFSLVWLGYRIDDLGDKRKEYIGGESTSGIEFEDLPPGTADIVCRFKKLDCKKGLVLQRYYSEMTRTLREMFRVLKPGKAAIVVVGNSIFRGMDTETAMCLADIGSHVGFEIPKIGTRNLDRNRRMMPAGSKLDLNSQIQQRMHQEYVIGFYKPRLKLGYPDME